MYKIGEALLGKGNEVAHIDLLVGDKEGNVGKAFAEGIAMVSYGHTPLLAVIRPNLPTKPSTLLVPKVTVKDMEDANKIFGPAQTAVAKAVADAVEEGIIPKDKIDEWVIIASVFIHPKAKDYRKIYQYNYGATKLALKRALAEYPNLDKLMYDKDRAVHSIMGFRVPRLWNPPYLQIAMDITSEKQIDHVLSRTPESDRILIEIGTPLIKEEGLKIIKRFRETMPNAFIVADLKTLDVGQVEVNLAFDETADAVVASGLAPTETLNKFIHEARKLGIYAFVDSLNVKDPIGMLKTLKELPDVVILHRGIDVELSGGKSSWDYIEKIKKEFKGSKILVAVAGGLEPYNTKDVLQNGADIIIVGRYITQSKDVELAVRGFLKLLGGDIDLHRIHLDED